MGNGPSLNKTDLGLLQKEMVWGSNRCYLLLDRIGWRPRFYVAVDRRVVPDNASEIGELRKQLPSTLFFFPVQFRLDGILQSADNVYWYKQAGLSRVHLPYGMFSADAADKVLAVYTVTIAMLQLAVYLGFNPIYLIGCDTDYSVPRSVSRDAQDSNLLTSTRDDDPNHFSSAYFGKGKKWGEPRTDRMIFQYEQAKIACDALEVEVINATVGGKLEVFPRINYKSLF